jgi:hypothetical protein
VTIFASSCSSQTDCCNQAEVCNAPRGPCDSKSLSYLVHTHHQPQPPFHSSSSASPAFDLGRPASCNSALLTADRLHHAQSHCHIPTSPVARVPLFDPSILCLRWTIACSARSLTPQRTPICHPANPLRPPQSRTPSPTASAQLPCVLCASLGTRLSGHQTADRLGPTRSLRPSAHESILTRFSREAGSLQR